MLGAASIARMKTVMACTTRVAYAVLMVGSGGSKLLIFVLQAVSPEDRLAFLRGSTEEDRERASA